MMKRQAISLFLILLLLLLPACSILSKAKDVSSPVSGDTSSSTKYTVGVSFLTTQLEYYLAYVEDLKKAAQEENVDLILTDAKWDPEKQKADIQGFIESGVDAIICSPTNPDEIRPLLLEAQKVGIPVIVEMTAVKDVYPLVGTDQFEGGVLAGEFAGHWINQRYDGICEVSILDFPYYQNINDRVEGFKKGLMATCPTAQIVAIDDGQAKMETASKKMSEQLAAHPKIRCVFGINDDTIKGANITFHELGMRQEDVCLIGFDADKSTRLLINNNEYIKASVAAKTDAISKACIQSAIRMLEGSEVPDWVEVTNAQFLISTENISLYLESGN